MSRPTIYLKLERDVETYKTVICLSDLAKITCSDKNILSKAKQIQITVFKDDCKRMVIGVLKIIEIVESRLPGVQIVPLGETDVLVELIGKVNKHSPALLLRAALVAAICFFGAAFTIMAFHNDVGISEMFGGFKGLVGGNEKEAFGLLEIAYSIGLAVGITVFFNHIGKRSITKDPTPVEVAMRTYETDVNTALVETACREKKAFDVE